LVCVGALAEAPPQEAQPDFKALEKVEAEFQSLDRDADRQISKTEARAERSLPQRFEGIDADANGYLSRAEFVARPSAEVFE
jgi:Ca2+-binding EF-hand superfamily protein